MKTIKYCLRTANDELGDETIHPQRQMEKLGCKVLAYEGMPIADCIFMEVDKLPNPMPKYVEVSEFKIQ